MAAFGSTAPFAEPLWYSRNSSPYYNDSHRKLRKFVRDHVDERIAPHCHVWETKGQVPQDVLQFHADMGFQAAAVYPMSKGHLSNVKLPAGIPNEEWDSFHDLIVIDEIARCGYLGVVWALTCGNSIGCPPVVNFGNEEQRKRFLPDVYAGRKRFCLAVTEPDAGSDVAGLTTTAERKGDVYVVNGAKKWITNGYFADYATTAVRTGGEGKNGISTLVIPLKAKGVTCKKISNSGVNASGSTYIEFDEVEVPVSNLLGKENEGFPIIMSNFNHERLWLACTSLRMARVCAQDAYAHACNRETFGKKLIENQVIRAKIQGFGQRIEPMHAYMEQLVHMVKEAKSHDDQQALYLGGQFANLKVGAGQVLEWVNREAQQILGGLGYARNGRGERVEQISRDLRVMVVGGGSEEILKELVVSQERLALRLKQSKL
ncbi:acyl-CoA dehydrogenase NM domain-like protein [Aureobasidium subglaciale]|nr:acyl-CoA dehydrogenase NM domain-like protein [Aureobasidium subglaciale]